MGKVCAFCNKGSQVGYKYKRRGMAKIKGGAGRKITGKMKRRFLPNLQKVKVRLNGIIQTVLACAKCIKVGKVIKVL